MLVRISQYQEPVSAAAPARSRPPSTAEVTVVLRISADSDQAPHLAARLVEAVRAALSLPTPGPATAAVVPIQNRQLDVVPPRQRWAPPAPPPLLRILVASRQVLRGDQPVGLTRLEFDLLLFLCRHPRQVHARQALLASVWGTTERGDTRTVDVHIRRIRGKLGPELAALIITVRGFGYRIDDLDRIGIVDSAV